MVGIDLKLPIVFADNTFNFLLKGRTGVHWANNFFSTFRLSAEETIRQMCTKISRQSSDKILLMLRPISFNVFRTNYQSQKPSRYRNISACNGTQTLSLRLPLKYISNHFSKGKRKSPLANIRRLRSHINQQGTKSLCQRLSRFFDRQRSLCSGFNNHRLMPDIVSMGKLSQAKSSGKASYANEPKRLYSYIYKHHRRQSPRCQYSRQADFRAGSNISYGQSLCRLCSPFYLHKNIINFCNKSQNQSQLYSNFEPASRKRNRYSKRSNNTPQRLLCFNRLSCCSSQSQLLRQRNKKETDLSNKQFHTPSFDNSIALQMPLADRNFLQMYQAVPLHKTVLRHESQCRQNPDLDRHQRLCSCCHYQERTKNRAEYRTNLSNSQPYTFREKPYHTSTYRKGAAKRKRSFL